MFLKIHYMLLYIQLFLQETCLNIYIVPHILLTDVYDWKGRAVKEMSKINFVALNILNQAQREKTYTSEVGKSIRALFVLLYVKVPQKAGGKNDTGCLHLIVEHTVDS